MKISLKNPKIRGSVLVVSMLLLVAGTVGMASLTSLISHRSRYVMNMELALQRRLAIRNSRALVQHYFMRQGIANSAPGGTIDIGGGWGKVSIPATGNSPLNSGLEFSLINFLSPGGNNGFTEDVTVTIEQPIPYDTGGAVTLTDYTVQLKSRSALLSGNLLVQHKPMLTPPIGVETDVQGSIQVNGNMILWEDADLTGDVGNLRVQSYDHPGTIGVNIKNLSGVHVPPTNFPFYTRSTGYATGAVGEIPILDGRFNMLEIGDGMTPDLKKQNSLHYKMVTNSSPTVVDGSFVGPIGAVSGSENGIGERVITINLDNPAVSPVIVNDGVFHVVLQGYLNSALADDEPPGFLLLRSNDLKSITLENNNYRRLVIGVDKDDASAVPVTVGLSSAAAWRLLLTVSKVGLQFDLPNTLTVQGGIRTDSRLNVASGTLALIRETNPESVELMDPRDGWIEIYRGL